MHLEMSLAVAVAIATLVAVIYTAFVGLLADMYVVLMIIVFTQIPDFYPMSVLSQLSPAKISMVSEVALTSAILSTVDSALLASSTSITHNILGQFIDFKKKKKLEIVLARFFIVLEAFFIIKSRF